MIATEAFLGVRAAREVSFRVIASPAGNYFGGELKPVSIWISREYARAGRGGTGAAKCGGNYAASLMPSRKPSPTVASRCSSWTRSGTMLSRNSGA